MLRGFRNKLNEIIDFNLDERQWLIATNCNWREEVAGAQRPGKALISKPRKRLRQRWTA